LGHTPLAAPWDVLGLGSGGRLVAQGLALALPGLWPVASPGLLAPSDL
jgi:hypothetical protein